MRASALCALLALILYSSATNADESLIPATIKVATAAFEAGFECGRAGKTHDECMKINAATLLEAFAGAMGNQL